MRIQQIVHLKLDIPNLTIYIRKVVASTALLLIAFGIIMKVSIYILHYLGMKTNIFVSSLVYEA